MNRIISNSPHIQFKHSSTPRVMYVVMIALFPAVIASVVHFGINALAKILFSVLICIVTETLISKFLLKKDLKKELSVTDGSAALTGLLLAFNVPVNIPLWQLAAGGIFAIGIVKMTFGGLGKNIFNPALAGRAFMLISFPAAMTSWPVPRTAAYQAADAVSKATDSLTGATPLGLIQESVGNVASLDIPGYLDMFLGSTGGCLGETSALAVLFGGLILLRIGVISWHIPLTWLAGLFGITGIFFIIDPAMYADPLVHILSGGAMLGAWFMATDYVTSPMSAKGKVIFGLSGGVLCALIRIFGAYPEGASYSILIMNAFVPLIDKYARPKVFGS